MRKYIWRHWDGARNLTKRAAKCSKSPKRQFITSKSGEDQKAVQTAFTKALDPTRDRIKINVMRAAEEVLIVETSTKRMLKRLLATKSWSKK